MRVGLELYARGTADPERVWALVGDLARLPEWTDADRAETTPDGVATVDGDRRLAWTVVTREQRLLEVETDVADGRLGLGVRVARDPGGTRVILACGLWPRNRWAAWRFRVLGAPAVRRRFDRWCHRALQIAGG